MAHTRKKGGVRKDKKNERMHEDVADRKERTLEPGHTTDQGDIMNFKPGGADDTSRQVRPNQPQKK